MLNPDDYPDIVAQTLTAYGEADASGVRRAHPGFTGRVAPGPAPLRSRAEREAAMDVLLAPGALRSSGAGNRPDEEEPDAVRTCFERDLDRIKHSVAFRVLAGKTQVFIASSATDEALRTRLTHSLEVAQVAVGVAQAVGLNVTATEAMAIGHDTAHGPIGHASEEAFSPFLPGGYDHAEYAATMLADLNLTHEVLDGITNHSWRRPVPSSVEAEVVSFADRIAYVCHDWDDAVRAGIVTPAQLPEEVAQVLGTRQSQQLRSLIGALTDGITSTGVVGLPEPYASALDTFRRTNYETIYMRPASRAQATKAIRLLTEVVEHFVDHPGRISAVAAGTIPFPMAGSQDAATVAVHHVAQMTDRAVLEHAVLTLGWDRLALPRGV